AMMLVSQLDIILGVESPATRSASSTLAQLAAVIERIGDLRPMPLLLGLAVIVTATLAARWSPKAPAPLMGVALPIAIARPLGVHEKEIGSLSAGMAP